ncbi:MAG: hypothetical protein K6T85_04585 [Gorillibacterium sp.]|nr:hypothetical protein [Gorillibacterium sp.]
MNKKILSFVAASVLLLSAVAPGAALAHNASNVNNGNNVSKLNYSNQSKINWSNWQQKNKEYLDKFKQQWKDKIKKNDEAKKTAVARVAADKAALNIQYGNGDKVNSVTKPFASLPVTGKKGSVITWLSSNPAVITSDGKIVNRPPVTTGDVKVLMIATITYGFIADYKVFELTVKATVNDAQKVAADKATLAIDFGGKDNAGSVTQPFDKLPTTGTNGSQIKWISYNPAIITNDGKTINRPTGGVGDVKVVLVATITNGSAADTKLFEVIVKAAISDAQKVALDKAALAIDFGGKDNAGSVTQPLDKLPAFGANGSQIKWISYNPAIITSDGKTLNRPVGEVGDVKVVLLATITNGYSVDTRLFEVTVKATVNSDAQKVAADKAALAVGFNGNDTQASVTRSVTLPIKGTNGSTVVWYSSQPSILSSDGKTLNRPALGAGDTNVILTAILTNGSSADTKTFTLVIKQQITDAQKVALDKAALNVSFNGSDYANSVTRALTLPILGVNGSTIIWVSSDPNVISNDGKTINRPTAGTSDRGIVLTAIIISNSVSDSKSFNIIVKKLP